MIKLRRILVIHDLRKQGLSISVIVRETGLAVDADEAGAGANDPDAGVRSAVARPRYLWPQISRDASCCNVSACSLARIYAGIRPKRLHVYGITKKSRWLGDRGIAWIRMVARDGIEPPTRGFSVLCSTD